MTAPKQTVLSGFAAKGEASYGAGGTLDLAQDALWLEEPVVVPAIEYLHDGQRAFAPDTGGHIKDAVPKGPMVTIAPKVAMRGAGAAYSSSVQSRDLHRFLKAAGFKHTLDATAGVEKITYVPSRLKADWTSLFWAGYDVDELVTGIGGYCDMQFDLADGGPGIATFPGLKSIVSALPVDAAVPSMTFQAPTLEPPRADNLAVQIQDVVSATAWNNVPVRNIGFRLNRAVGGNRVNLSQTGGLLGWSLGGYKPVLELTIEASALVAGSPYVGTTGLNPYQLRATRRKLAISFGWGVGGTGNYNLLAFVASQAYVRSVRRERADPDALWVLELQLACSAPGVDDACALVTG